MVNVKITEAQPPREEDAKTEVDRTLEIQKGQSTKLGVEGTAESPGVEEDSSTEDMVLRVTRRESEADAVQPGLQIPQMKDTSMSSVGHPLSKVMEQLNETTDASAWRSEDGHPEQPFRTCVPGATPDQAPCGDYSERLPPAMDFYRFALEGPGAGAAGSCNHDLAGDGQPANVLGGHETVGAETCKEDGPGAVEARGTTEEAAVPASQSTGSTEAIPPPDNPSDDINATEEEAGLEQLETQTDAPAHAVENKAVEKNSPSELSHPADFRYAPLHYLNTSMLN